MTAITLDLHSIVKLTDEQFYQLCLDNPDVKFERTASGELIVMPPTGWGTGKNQRVEIYRQGQPVEIRTGPTTLSGEDVLPEFVLDLKGIL
jgi:Uma2 family endonuclease